MNNVNKTLYIPLYGKSYVSRKGILLHDPKAEQIWAAGGFPLKGKSKSKWLAYYMGMRAAVFDRWVAQQLEADPSAVVIHIGCGMDSRCLRVEHRGHLWFDLDFPEVINERKRYYSEAADYKMLCADVREAHWLSRVPTGSAVVIMEGVSMYISVEELIQTLTQLVRHFASVRLLMDCYTEFAAKATKVKNPINDVGVTQVHGLDDSGALEISGLRFVKEHEMTPADLVDELQGMEKRIFRMFYAGGIAKKMYRLYEYKSSKGGSHDGI